ncbi:MAG: hypothetical protein ABW092_07555 [Candidatus Thiodiazotropha sp.]
MKKPEALSRTKLMTMLLLCTAVAAPIQTQAIDIDQDPYTTTKNSKKKYDSKTYPGRNCIAQDANEANKFSNLAFGMYFHKDHSGYLYVDCPIVRDNTENTNGTYAVYVNVTNPPRTTMVECTLYSYSSTGSLLESYTDKTPLSGNRVLYLDVDYSSVGGYYGITCLLPSLGSVISYEVREYLNTDDEGG